MKPPPPPSVSEAVGPLTAVRVGTLWAWISERDADLVSQYHWRPHRRPHTIYAMCHMYRVHPVKGRYRSTEALHRMVKGAGPLDIVDHEDRDGLHCWQENLRVTDTVGNMQNRLVGSVPFLGVSLTHSGENPRYRARIRDLSGRQCSIGTFKIAEEAARAFDAAAFKLYGPRYLGFNFPDEMRALAGLAAAEPVKADDIPF